jgi:ATP-dependent DNA ligase
LVGATVGRCRCCGAYQGHANSFTIDGDVLGLDGLSRFEELSRREGARTAILYAFDLVEQDGEDMRNRPFLEPQERLRAAVA